MRNTGADLDTVARGAEEYYTGAKEAPGEWHGAASVRLGLSGEVDAELAVALGDAARARSFERGRRCGVGLSRAASIALPRAAQTATAAIWRHPRPDLATREGHRIPPQANMRCSTPSALLARQGARDESRYFDEARRFAG